MTRWLRVFGTRVRAPEPAELLDFLRGLVKDVRGDFRGDAQGWFEAEVALGGERPPLHLERYLATEEGIRHELNAWAAWVETFEGHPAQSFLMQHLTSTAQVFAIPAPSRQRAEGMEGRSDRDLTPGRPAHEENEGLSISLCRFLAKETSGVYQVDDKGFYNSDGIMLLAEE